MKTLKPIRKVSFALAIGALAFSTSLLVTPKALAADVKAKTKIKSAKKIEHSGSVSSYTVDTKTTAGKTSLENEYTVSFRQVDASKYALEADIQEPSSGAFSGLVAQTAKTDSAKKKDEYIAFEITMEKEGCDCDPIVEIRAFKKDQITDIAVLLKTIQKDAAKTIKDTENTLAKTEEEERKERISEEKREKQIANCEINEDGESLKGKDMKDERIECLIDRKFMNAETDKEEMKLYQKHFKGDIQKMLLSQNPEKRERGFELLETLMDSASSEEVTATIGATYRGTQALNAALKYAQDLSLTNNPRQKMYVNYQLDQLRNQLAHDYSYDYEIRNSSYAYSEATSWLNRIQMLTTQVIENPSQVSDQYFKTIMEQPVQDILRPSNPVVSNPSTSSGRLYRGSTSIALPSYGDFSHHNLAVTQSQASRNRDALLSRRAPQQGQNQRVANNSRRAFR